MRGAASAVPEEEVDVKALLRAADVADLAARTTLPTLEEERAIINAAEALARKVGGHE